MAYTLYLAEKPSQARDLAKVIGVAETGDGFMKLSDGSYMTHARGHLLEQAEPQEYDPAWGGRWAWAQLPMIPERFKLKPVYGVGKQLDTIGKLLKGASTVVIATDAGREGELIARNILAHFRFTGEVKRLWTSSLTDADIRKALAALKPGSATEPLMEAAQARAHSDWIIGMTLTRAVTLAAQVRGDFFPVGRVKSATLALVVRRDKAIAEFDSKPYFELEAQVDAGVGELLKMTHAPGPEARITDKAVATAMMKKAEGANAPLQVARTPESEGAPLPYSLPALQKDANRVFGFSAKHTLELAQALYEKHKVASYPRTDCAYLAKSQIDEVPDTLAAVSANFSKEVAALKAMGVVTRASTFDDAKLVDHHGIIPTRSRANFSAMSADERKLYQMVALRYLQVLAPDCRLDATRVSMNANGVVFKATERVVSFAGWKSFKSADDAADDAQE